MRVFLVMGDLHSQQDIAGNPEPLLNKDTEVLNQNRDLQFYKYRF